jgi:hypothetical protein
MEVAQLPEVQSGADAAVQAFIAVVARVSARQALPHRTARI